MATKLNGLNRRDFLKQSAAVGVGALIAPYAVGDVRAASRERVTIYHNTVADSIHLYKQSSGSIYGNWQHVFEPLVELDYKKRIGSACSPSRGNSRVRAGCSN
jgi:hypothetical protein